ncbi:unnamed protein product [Cyprideis torosa]|uniref:Uncharacterized protein n=1 Tax=Cyprideis torosa TaxID=163714 RepID=A0A7R8W154_9CRUS|nr:unnamed protein product [Cyprideis torosa]CAG0880544.1 unnamed protein product [Cyprideis torosa]
MFEELQSSSSPERAPQVLPQATEEEVSVNKGDDARLVVTFCSDPPPQRSFWQWGSLALNVGDSNGKYQARKLLKNYRKDCYEAHLIVEGADLEDQRFYHLQIENERGKDGVAVELLVKAMFSLPLQCKSSTPTYAKKGSVVCSTTGRSKHVTSEQRSDRYSVMYDWELEVACGLALLSKFGCFTPSENRQELIVAELLKAAGFETSNGNPAVD